MSETPAMTDKDIPQNSNTEIKLMDPGEILHETSKTVDNLDLDNTITEVIPERDTDVVSLKEQIECKVGNLNNGANPVSEVTKPVFNYETRDSSKVENISISSNESALTSFKDSDPCSEDMVLRYDDSELSELDKNSDPGNDDASQNFMDKSNIIKELDKIIAEDPSNSDLDTKDDSDFIDDKQNNQMILPNEDKVLGSDVKPPVCDTMAAESMLNVSQIESIDETDKIIKPHADIISEKTTEVEKEISKSNLFKDIDIKIPETSLMGAGDGFIPKEKALQEKQCSQIHTEATQSSNIVQLLKSDDNTTKSINEHEENASENIINTVSLSNADLINSGIEQMDVDENIALVVAESEPMEVTHDEVILLPIKNSKLTTKAASIDTVSITSTDVTYAILDTKISKNINPIISETVDICKLPNLDSSMIQDIAKELIEKNNPDTTTPIENVDVQAQALAETLDLQDNVGANDCESIINAPSSSELACSNENRNESIPSSSEDQNKAPLENSNQLPTETIVNSTNSEIYQAVHLKPIDTINMNLSNLPHQKQLDKTPENVSKESRPKSSEIKVPNTLLVVEEDVEMDLPESVSITKVTDQLSVDIPMFSSKQSDMSQEVTPQALQLTQKTTNSEDPQEIVESMSKNVIKPHDLEIAQPTLNSKELNQQNNEKVKLDETHALESKDFAHQKTEIAQTSSKSNEFDTPASDSKTVSKSEKTECIEPETPKSLIESMDNKPESFERACGISKTVAKSPEHENSKTETNNTEPPTSEIAQPSTNSEEIETQSKETTETPSKSISPANPEEAKLKSPKPSTSKDTESHEMQPDQSDEVPDTTDSLGLLAETFRSIEDGDEQEDDHEEPDDEDGDDGEDDDDFDHDDESNQVPETSEDSNVATNSETDHDTNVADPVKSPPLDNAGTIMAVETLSGNVVEAITDIEIEENKVTSEIDLETLEQVELKLPQTPDALRDVITTNEDAVEEVDATKDTTQQLSKLRALLNEAKASSDTDRVTPTKPKKLEISKPKNIVNIVELEETSSEDDIQEVTRPSESEATADDNSSSSQAPPAVAKSVRINTSEITIKTKSAAAAEPTLVIPEIRVGNVDVSTDSKPKCGLEVFNLDSDEDSSSKEKSVGIKEGNTQTTQSPSSTKSQSTSSGMKYDKNHLKKTVIKRKRKYFVSRKVKKQKLARKMESQESRERRRDLDRKRIANGRFLQSLKAQKQRLEEDRAWEARINNQKNLHKNDTKPDELLTPLWVEESNEDENRSLDQIRTPHPLPETPELEKDQMQSLHIKSKRNFSEETQDEKKRERDGHARRTSLRIKKLKGDKKQSLDNESGRYISDRSQKSDVNKHQCLEYNMVQGSLSEWSEKLDEDKNERLVYNRVQDIISQWSSESDDAKRECLEHDQHISSSNEEINNALNHDSFKKKQCLDNGIAGRLSLQSQDSNEASVQLHTSLIKLESDAKVETKHPYLDSSRIGDCVNPTCDGTSNHYIKANAAILRFYDTKKKKRKRAVVCENCAHHVGSRLENLMEGVKCCDTRLMSLHMERKGEQLVEISDSDSDSEAEDKLPNIVGDAGFDFLENKFAEMVNSTWIKYNLAARMADAKDEIVAEIEQLEKDSKEIDDMLTSCQKLTDQVRNDLYAAFARPIHHLSPIDIDENCTVKVGPDISSNNDDSNSETDGQVRRSKRTRISKDEPPSKRAAIPLGFKNNTEDSNADLAKDSKDDDIRVVRLSSEAAPPSLPPPGELRRAALRVGMPVYGMRHTFGAWSLAVIENVGPADVPNFKSCRVKFENKVKGQFKQLLGRHLAYAEPADVRLTIGTRVIALFIDTSESKKKTSFYSGVIAEVPNPVNVYRYLVFFDDGYAQYVQHADIRVVCETSALVWEEVHTFSREFVKSYLLAYPERPMVRLHAGQSLKTEWNGKWWPSKVLAVDASLVNVYFEADKRTEWIYRGSTRLAPLFIELQAAERPRHRALHSSASRHHKNMPYVEYTRSNEQEDEKPSPEAQQQQEQEEIKRQRAVAKKSTMQPFQPQPPPSVIQSPSDSVLSRVVYYTPKAAVKPHKMQAHVCSIKCKRTDVLPLNELRTYNPLARPLLSGWERQIVRYRFRKDVVYRAPCGRRLRNIQEVHRYLRDTFSEMSVDLFDFNPQTHCLAEFVLNRCLVSKKDLSHGKENVPVPCVNYYDSSLPEFCSYNTERTPTQGVPLNTDPEFLCGCDCTDDCQDKSKCACWKMTMEGAKTIGMEDTAGYVYKRLLEPVPSGIYECNSRCKCSKTCLNRVAQHPLQLKLQVFKTLNRGWGIRALNDVPKGAFLCVYAGNLLTDATANLDGLNEGDEYLAELDYIEVVEQMKEGYEDDVPEKDKRLDQKSSASSETSDQDPSEEDEGEAGSERSKDEDFRPDPAKMGHTPHVFSKRLRKRSRKGQQGENEKERDKDKPKDKDGNEEDCITISDDEEMRKPSRFNAEAGMDPDEFISRNRSVRSFFGKDEACYIMDAKVQGNIGRYLNHSCTPNVFVQNVFVDTHDPRFPWVAFFALSHIKAGTELTWNYNYDIGSVPGKVLYCYCGAPNCRRRLL